MYLQIKPYHTNLYSQGGILIKGDNLHHWLQELQRLEVDLDQVPVFPIPGKTADSIWGCFVPLPPNKLVKKEMNACEPCQLLYNKLYLPQYAIIYPMLGAEEIEKLFSSHNHILHPEFGLVVMDTPIVWSDALLLPMNEEVHVRAPLPGAFVPGTIRRLEIKPLAPEELLKSMEETLFPQKEKFNDKPLNWTEKIKLGILHTLFTKGGDKENPSKFAKTFIWKALDKMMGKSKLLDKLEDGLEQLEKRNQTEMEKLMQLFKNNPEEALKYAIPLDEQGTNRGGNFGRFEMSKRWQNFDLFSRTGSSNSGNSPFGSDAYLRLQEQYNKTAVELVKQGNYEKAAFVYMKLLKNNFMAARTLEDGKLYPEAASVYLKYLQDKPKAAECYEKGQMFTDAIELYKELKQNEKAGDLYMLQHKTPEAFEQYQFVADGYVDSSSYVKAAVLYRNKMNNMASAQNLLLKGWRSDKDAFNCINNYFKNIEDPKLLLQAIENVYEKDVTDYNKPVFLNALKYEYKKAGEFTERTKEMAYEIIADLASRNPDIVSELKNFNKDNLLVKDLVRYKTQHK